jgi:hypothetical protein
VFLGRRLRQLATERDKLLRAYHADAIDVETLKREQKRISAEVADAEAQLAADGEKLNQAKEVIDLALTLARDCAASYRKARPDVRKMWNRAFFREIFVEKGNVIRFEYEEPFATLLGSHKGQIVDLRGIEPLTSCLPIMFEAVPANPRMSPPHPIVLVDLRFDLPTFAQHCPDSPQGHAHFTHTSPMRSRRRSSRKAVDDPTRD